MLAFLVDERSTGTLLVALIGLALGISWAVCVVMSYLLHGQLRWDYLLTGSIAPLLAAPAVLGVLLVVIQRLRELTSMLERLAVTDPLTGVYNRRALDSYLARETERANRYSRPLSLIVVDLDRFKEVNDRLGHAAGDRALVAAVASISANLRRSDQVFRTGGDEFVVLLPETELDQAEDIAQRICRQNLTTEGPLSRAVTKSCGVAGYVRGGDPGALLEAADKAMYRAKKAGGDRVEGHSASS